MPGKKTARVKTSGCDKIHIHFENNADLGEVFEVTRKRVADALSGHPELRGRIKFTIGLDGDILEKALSTADVLFGYNFRTELAKRAPHLRWVHAHGAGVGHLMPLDWLPRGAVLTNSRGIHGDKAEEYPIMALLMLNNEIPRNVSNQRFAKWDQLFTDRIGGKTVIIVGVGNIGGGAAKWPSDLVSMSSESDALGRNIHTSTKCTGRSRCGKYCRRRTSSWWPLPIRKSPIT